MGVRLTSRIPAMIAEAEGRAALVVAKTVSDIETGAKDRARVDTGAMQAEIEGQADGTSGKVVGGSDHHIYNELGTVKVPAQPMLIPAAEEARNPFLAAMAQILK